MNVKRYYEETMKIIRESDSLSRKPVWTEGDFIQAQVLINFFCTLALYAYLRGSKPLSGVALALQANPGFKHFAQGLAHSGYRELLEQLREENGRQLYLADGQWLPTRERHETFFIKGQRPQREVIHETRNGPLLNSRGSERQHAMQPLPLNSRYGLALRHIQLEQDQTLDAFFALSRAQSVDHSACAAVALLLL